MRQKLVGNLRTILTLAMISKRFGFGFASSMFHRLNLHCDLPWENTDENSYGLDLISSAALCLSPLNVAECTLVKCRSMTKDCEIVKTPFNYSMNCIRNSGPEEQNVFLRSEFIQEQRTELAVVDLKIGRLEPVADETISPISIPATGANTPLQIQWGQDILSCALDTIECSLWIERSTEWISFPSLSHVHYDGSLSLVGNTPIVIGGKADGSSLTTHGIVEIYNQNTRQWNIGPPLQPIRRRHFTVVLNETSLVVIGGYDSAALSSVKILNVDDLTWKDLDDLTSPTYGLTCGLVDDTLILCIGGRQSAIFANTAYELDMSSSNPEWKARPSFNLEQPAMDGFIMQLRDHLYCMTILLTEFKHSSILRRMNLKDTTPSWEIMKVFPDNSFYYVLPYVTSGYSIRL